MIFMVMSTPRVEGMVMEVMEVMEIMEIMEITEITEITEIKLKSLCRRKREMVLGYVKGQ
jgi:hypothetical protein